jgi:hypothetical protein
MNRRPEESVQVIGGKSAMKMGLVRLGICLGTVLLLTSAGYGQQPKATTLKAVLLEQLRSTHNKAEWFVPANTAVAGITP